MHVNISLLFFVEGGCNMTYEEVTGAIDIEELEVESEEMTNSVGGSTNSTRNSCRCPWNSPF